MTAGPKTESAKILLGMHVFRGALQQFVCRALFKHMDDLGFLLQHLIMSFNETTGNEVANFFSFGLNF